MRLEHLRVLAVLAAAAAALFQPPQASADPAAADPAAANQTCPNPDALGVWREQVVDTAGGPIFGDIQYVQAPTFLHDKEVVLTFDDGPFPETTPAILAALAQQCTKATFFYVGRMALRNPDVLAQVDAAGMTIGSHTWSHADLRKLPGPRAQAEIERGISMLNARLGHPIAPFFRFPYLSDPKAEIHYLGGRDFAVFSADVDSWDSHGLVPSGRIVNYVMTRLKEQGHGIVLMHDIKHTTAAALPEILRLLKEGGWKIVNLVAKTPAASLPPFDSWAHQTIDENDTHVLIASNDKLMPAPLKVAANGHHAKPAAPVTTGMDVASLTPDGLSQAADRRGMVGRAVAPVTVIGPALAADDAAPNGGPRGSGPGATEPAVAPQVPSVLRPLRIARARLTIQPPPLRVLAASAADGQRRWQVAANDVLLQAPNPAGSTAEPAAATGRSADLTDAPDAGRITMPQSPAPAGRLASADPGAPGAQAPAEGPLAAAIGPAAIKDDATAPQIPNDAPAGPAALPSPRLPSSGDDALVQVHAQTVVALLERPATGMPLSETPAPLVAPDVASSDSRPAAADDPPAASAQAASSQATSMAGGGPAQLAAQPDPEHPQGAASDSLEPPAVAPAEAAPAAAARQAGTVAEAAPMGAPAQAPVAAPVAAPAMAEGAAKPIPQPAKMPAPPQTAPVSLSASSAPRDGQITAAAVPAKAPASANAAPSAKPMALALAAPAAGGMVPANMPADMPTDRALSVRPPAGQAIAAPAPAIAQDTTTALPEPRSLQQASAGAAAPLKPAVPTEPTAPDAKRPSAAGLAPAQTPPPVPAQAAAETAAQTRVAALAGADAAAKTRAQLIADSARVLRRKQVAAVDKPASADAAPMAVAKPPKPAQPVVQPAAAAPAEKKPLRPLRVAKAGPAWLTPSRSLASDTGSSTGGLPLSKK